MARVQISKIQQRAGNLVDLPQLDNGEFGWATDTNRLFIGKTGNVYADENIEVLTSYSNISFSQINGSGGGNFNINSPQNGQILTYVSSTGTWENYSGNTSQFSGTKLQLGSVSNISMTGGAIGYVLQTDGVGNLSWTPNGTLFTTIKGLVNGAANIIVMTVSNTTPYTNKQAITISGATATNANSIVNGLTFYVKLATDYATSGNVTLYTDSTLSTGSNGYYLGSYTANSGLATAVVGGSGGGGGNAGGSNTTVQFNDQNISNGVAGFTFDKSTTTLTVSSGNIVTGNLNATSLITAPRLVSNIATGTSPLSVTSTTRVANLNVAYANVTDYVSVTFQATGTYYPLLTSATSGNVAQSANAGLAFNVDTGTLTATAFTGRLTTNAQPNITSVGTLTSLSVTGNISSGNASLGNLATANYVNVNNILTVTGNANVGNLGTSTAIITTSNITTINSGLLQNGNSNVSITSNSNVSIAVAGFNKLVLTSTGANITGTANISGNANVGNLGTSGLITATGNITGSQVITTVTNGTAPFVVTSTTQVANLFVATANVAYSVAGANVTGAVAYATTANAVAGGNVSGQVGNALVAGTVYTAAQANITSVGTLTGLTLANAAIISVGSNTNVGTFTGNFSLSAGSRLNATYADLAEYYEADARYEAGTVLAFGGDKEVTLSEDGTTRVAGVVSTNPAYVMNSLCRGQYIVALALQGRVPCKVRGTIRKGDMLISGGNGYARVSNSPNMGTVIGKALENFEGEGIIEVAVGRL